ncbi:Glycerophosphocholine phosphodiesterase GPCPD1 [Bagarius yarrelli]|uniref:Glycerophosphocholine phosphodiesterase GPCPD1 n=1 Tax=Bagarius yarrelli TaxID=175774 RepID=A0A556TSM2_BAGYA|nr:Glycerophosphocholine phosphodiesterase GPCPD1 [Bagarius yarrelli]
MSLEVLLRRQSLKVKGNREPRRHGSEVIAVVGSCETLGNWCHQKAVPLKPTEEDGCAVKETENNTDTSFIFTDSDRDTDDGQFGFYNDVECVDSGWLTCQTEIRLRLHYSVKPPVSITKKKYKTSRFRLKLMLEGTEEEEDEESPSSWHKMTTTLEISMISDSGYKSRHSQPDCGYALEPARWTEYSIHTMEPDNLELVFEFFEEDLSEKVVQSDVHPGHVGIACLLSSTFLESGKDNGVVTLPIMSRSSRQTIGKVRVDYLVIRPISGFTCDMSECYAKYWRKRSALDVGHRGAGSTHAAKHHKIRENTIASFLSAASHGAAYVEFDVHLSKDLVPIVYHDLTCCISTKKKNDKNSMVLFEVPVKDLTFDQLQLLKLAHSTAMKVNDHKDLQDEEEYIDEHQPFPSLSQIFQTVPDNVGFNIELKWISQMKDGTWDGNLSTYFNMNQFLDVILTCVLQNAGKRRIVFSCFDPDGISAHTEELLRNMDCITEAQSKGLVVFCWGDDNNDHENRRLLREKGIDGLIYDRICDAQVEQPNIFKVEEKVSIKEVIPEETLKSCACSTYSISCSAVPCSGEVRAGSAESDSGLSSS